MTNSRSASKKSTNPSSRSLRVIRPNVAGVDVGSKQHWVAGPERADGKPNVAVFGTMTDELNRLADWLLEQGVKSVAMESTYLYWIPLYELLESRGLEVVLVNARQLHNVPGRKTDFADCQWLQLLHSCGLLRGSFRPSEAITRLRALQRQRGNLMTQRTRCIQWMQKALDQMNIQVHRAVSDLTGATGLAIVRDIVAGERDPLHLARHRDRRCRKSVEEIARYLTGNWRQEHLFNLAEALRLYDAVEESIASYDARLLEEIEALQPPERQSEQVPPHPNQGKEKSIRTRGDQKLRTTLWRFAGADLCRIDGISVGTAQTILTELGTNLAAFPTEHNFVSWLRLCPRTPISGGKPLKKRRNALGANRIAGALRMAALTLARSKTALGGAFRRLARRTSGALAVFATARTLAQLVYRMLRYGQDYVDIGEQAYEQRFHARRLEATRQAAKSLGYELTPLPAQATATG
jgi:transposase